MIISDSLHIQFNLKRYCSSSSKWFLIIPGYDHFGLLLHLIFLQNVMVVSHGVAEKNVENSLGSGHFPDYVKIEHQKIHDRCFHWNI